MVVHRARRQSVGQHEHGVVVTLAQQGQIVRVQPAAKVGALQVCRAVRRGAPDRHAGEARQARGDGIGSKPKMHGVPRPCMGQLEVQQMPRRQSIAAPPQRYPRGGVATEDPARDRREPFCPDPQP